MLREQLRVSTNSPCRDVSDDADSDAVNLLSDGLVVVLAEVGFARLLLGRGREKSFSRLSNAIPAGPLNGDFKPLFFLNSTFLSNVIWAF